MPLNWISRATAKMTAAATALWAGGSQAALDLNLTKGVTSLSREVYSLHMLILIICVIIGVVVFGVMFYSMYHHRKSKGAVPAQFHESTTVEVVWTVIPMLILIGIAIPATKTLIAMENTEDSDLTILVTGYQWKWKYDYVGENISFFSSLSTPRAQIAGLEPKGENYLLEVDNPVVIPVGKKVRFLTTAADVIHSWWVPALGWKRDAIPGFVNESWARVDTPGTYRGQCAELCGKDHGFMPVVVIAKTEAEFEQWKQEQGVAVQQASAAADREWAMAELLTQGQKVYQANCVACHQANGQGMADMFPPLAGSAVTTSGPVSEHVAAVFSGRQGTAMQAFATQLNDVDLAAVVTYTRNAWGNDTGDLVQPSQIKDMR